MASTKTSKVRRAVLFLLVLGIVLAPVLAFYMDNAHMLNVAQRIVITAIAVMGLNLILGFGGLVSLGHAAFIGIGGYAIGILSYHEITSGWVQWPVAIVACALGALLIGALSLRTRGVYFIMVTLAFAQMVYYVASGLQLYGGDDGLTIYDTSDFGHWLPLGDGYVLYGVSLLILALTAGVIHVVKQSPFGLVLRGAAINERRVKAIGYSTYRYQLVAFVLSGVICGVAGMLLANQNSFISPATMHWTRSAELVIMIILGGSGTVFGPLFGVVAYLMAEELFSSQIVYWQAALGVLLFIIIRFAPGGFDAFFTRRRRND